MGKKVEDAPPLELLAKIVVMAKTGAKIIICDCARHNVFAALQLTNTFVPGIEWDKHQAPSR